MALKDYRHERLEEIKVILGGVYEYRRTLKDFKIELLAIGDDEHGGSVQVRLNDLKHPEQIVPWLNRAIKKVKKVSWVHIEMSGHDEDGDYHSRKFEFSRKLGADFLEVCATAAIDNTPLHQILTIEYLSS